MINKSRVGNNDYKLIVAIVKKGLGSRLVAVAGKAGAERSTIMLGRGTADKSVYINILGIDYEPEKEILLIPAKSEIVEKVLETIVKEGNLEKKGRGLAFIIDMKSYKEILNLMVSQEK